MERKSFVQNGNERSETISNNCSQLDLMENPEQKIDRRKENESKRDTTNLQKCAQENN